MPELKDLMPKIKVGDLGVGHSLKIDNGEYVVQVQNKADEVVVTLEFIGNGPGWGVIKVVNPDLEADLPGLIEVLQKAIDAVIKHQKRE
jgi:hypothetical protein